MTVLTAERVRELRDAASNVTIQVNDNVWIGLGPMIRALCDAWLAAQEPKGDGWRPIETAPRDTPVLVGARQGKGEWSAFVAMFATRYGWSGWKVCGVHGYEWETDFDAPTHWRPLPEAPHQRCEPT